MDELGLTPSIKYSSASTARPLSTCGSSFFLPGPCDRRAHSLESGEESKASCKRAEYSPNR
jgi:hypothetical protein